MEYFSHFIEFLFNSLKDFVLADVISSVGLGVVDFFCKEKKTEKQNLIRFFN